MPLTNSGKTVLGSMEKTYGEDKAKEVFYASINANKEGSRQWETKLGRHDRTRRGK